MILGAPVVAFTVCLAAPWAATDDTLGWIATWHRVVDSHAGLAQALTVVAFIAQGRAQSTPPGRRHVRRVILAAVTVGGFGLVFYLLPPFMGRQSIDPNLAGVIATAFPITVAIPIVRHNLFDIDRLLSHAMVHGGPTAATDRCSTPGNSS